VPVQASVIVPLCGPTDSVVASMLTFSVAGVVPPDWPSFIQVGSEGVALNDRSITLSLLFRLIAWAAEALPTEAWNVREDGLSRSVGEAALCTVTVPPLADVAIAPPCASAATLLANWTREEVFVVELDTSSDIVATTPFKIGVQLGPHSTQVVAPGLLLQAIDLFAVMATGPAVTSADEKSTVE